MLLTQIEVTCEEKPRNLPCSISSTDRALYGGPLSPFMDVTEEDDYLIGSGSDLEARDSMLLGVSEALKSKQQVTLVSADQVSSETRTSASCESLTSQAKKTVTFGAVKVREHSVILGDHPLCQMLPLSLGWNHAPEVVHNSIDDHHEYKRRQRLGQHASSCPTINLTSEPLEMDHENLSQSIEFCRESPSTDLFLNQEDCTQESITGTAKCGTLLQNLACNDNQFRQGLSWPSSTKRLSYNERKVLLKRLSGLGESDLMKLERHRRRMVEKSK